MARNIKAVAQSPEPQSAAADGDTESTVDTATDSKRKQVSKRLFIDANGNEVERIELATGARYVLLDPNGNHTFDEQSGAPAGSKVAMGFTFGMHTKLGNVANTVLNDKDEPGTPADAAAAIRDWLAQLDGGTWAERTGGVGGQRIDRDALAGSMVACLLAAGKLDAAGEGAAYAKIRQRLDDEKGYLTGAMKVTEFAQEYAKRTGKAQKTMADFV